MFDEARRRSHARPADLVLGLSSSVFTFMVATAGCGTDAVGIDACRQIEQARCEAAPACGLIAEEDVDDCRIFYRDHCLHGLPGEQPPPDAVADCVSAITAAGECARADGSGALISDCPGVSADRGPATLACDVVRAPERADRCSFLGPASPGTPPAEGGAGGQDGNDEAGQGGA